MFKYKVIWSGSVKEIEDLMNLAAHEGWELCSFTSTAAGANGV